MKNYILFRGSFRSKCYFLLTFNQILERIFCMLMISIVYTEVLFLGVSATARRPIAFNRNLEDKSNLFPIWLKKYLEMV